MSKTELVPTQVSGSRAGRFLACPSSEYQPEGEYRFAPHGIEAKTGSAAHEAIACGVNGQDVDIACVCHDHETDPEEVSFLYALAMQAWKDLRPFFPEPRVEFNLRGDLTYGRADVIHTDGETLSIIDWDFGWAGTDKRAQLKAYADAARVQFGMPTKGRIDAFHVLCRKGTFLYYGIEERELGAFREQVQQSIKRCGKYYAPDHYTCRYCQRQLVCSARKDYLQQSVSALTELGTDVECSDEALVALYPRWRDVGKLVEVFDRLLTDRLGRGDLDLGNGKVLTLVEQSRDVINPMKAWPIMAGQLSDEQIARALTVGKTALLDAVAENVGRGGKKKAKDAFLDQLRKSGAVTTTTRKVRTEVAI